MKSSKVRQVVLPLITALIWGSAFVTQSLSAAHLGCFSFNALRAIPAVLVLLVLLAVMQRIHPREKYSAEEKPPSKRCIKISSAVSKGLSWRLVSINACFAKICSTVFHVSCGIFCKCPSVSTQIRKPSRTPELISGTKRRR